MDLKKIKYWLKKVISLFFLIARHAYYQPAKIKNCGLKTSEDIICAVSTGASFIGFVHYPASPRHLDGHEIAALFPYVAGAAKVIVLVNPDDSVLQSLPKPDFWQIHDVNDPARIAAIHHMTGVPVITALRIKNSLDLMEAEALENVSEYLLFDAYHPLGYGGNGIAFDWSILKSLKLKKPWFLAGGLNPTTVRQAISETHAPMVDVSSGIEDAPGIKSQSRIREFNSAVKDEPDHLYWLTE